MSNITSKVITGAKYVYLILFFVFLAGIFNPIINERPLDQVIFGVIVLFVGLAGSILVYKAAITENKRGILLGGGFALIAISFYYIIQFTGRV
ncbi:hypothetical protein MnTg01_00041 [archaeon MnTg01]|nr:hypothetical protein MnTg01_00041 [archaeon MnTg01]